jgi:FAD dependent oxidoreductase TIGR03364
VLVVGGGIVGLAFAWEAARRGLSVRLLERSRAACGASVRNFGMVWPIGQPAGRGYDLALRSRARWLELSDAGVIWAAECGSVHAVGEADEAAVLAEFVERAGREGIACELLTGAEARRRFPALAPDVRATLWSPTELVVDPPRAIGQIAVYLQEQQGVEIRCGSTVTAVEMPEVRTAAGERFTAERVIVCGGADFETLFPEVWGAAGVRRCKLQMMRTVPQPGGWRLGPHVAGGLTLAHYAGFAGLPSLAHVRRRLAEQFPFHVAAGIHVMASQNDRGEVILGDSHDYTDVESPFDSAAIDAAIIDYARGMLDLPDWTIAERWHGVYAKSDADLCFTAEPQPACTIMGSPGGAGMTLAFGLAAEWWERQDAADGQPAARRARPAAPIEPASPPRMA